MVKGAPDDLPSKITQILNANSDKRWEVNVGVKSGSPTLKEEEELARKQIFSAAYEHPIAKDVLKAFPGTKITEVIRINQNEDLKSSPLLEASDLTTNLD